MSSLYSDMSVVSYVGINFECNQLVICDVEIDTLITVLGILGGSENV